MLCSVHGFVYWCGFVENIRSRVLFCDVWDCVTQISALLYLALYSMLTGCTEGQLGGFKVRKAHWRCLRSGEHDPEPPFTSVNMNLWRIKQNKTLAMNRFLTCRDTTESWNHGLNLLWMLTSVYFVICKQNPSTLAYLAYKPSSSCRKPLAMVHHRLNL